MKEKLLSAYFTFVGIVIHSGCGNVRHGVLVMVVKVGVMVVDVQVAVTIVKVLIFFISIIQV